ncbi:MAG: DnaJ domain-containing protein [Hyphomicrobiaceae bacterium]|nr:DnaJ domain-containing protein [Hyphomicrobiaceae bacterium]
MSLCSAGAIASAAEPLSNPGTTPGAGERIALPFACSIEAGKVRLRPSREHFYAIFGRRPPQSVTTCDDAANATCVTLVAHRFGMLCGGRRVQWAEVAAAIGGRRTSRVWMADQKLNIVVKRPPAAPPATGAGSAGSSGCGTDAAAVSGEARTITVIDRPCSSETGTADEMHFVMPPGHAPLKLFGARLVLAAASPADGLRVPDVQASDAPTENSGADRTAAARGSSSPGASAYETRRAGRPAPKTTLQEPAKQKTVARMGDVGRVATAPAGEDRQRRDRLARLIDRTIVTEPLPEIGEGDDAGQPNLSHHAAAGPPPPQSWLTTIRHGDDATVEAELAGIMPLRDILAWMMMTSLIAAGGWYGWSRQTELATMLRQRIDAVPFAKVVSTVAERARNRVTLKPAASAAASNGPSYATEPVEMALSDVEHSVRNIAAKAPIRSVLEDELRRARQRLAVAKAAGCDEFGPGRIGAAAFRVITRDLDRIRRIADSARDSLDGGAGEASARMPQSPAEAYEILGINPNASPATVKKFLDALRMSWHPDLARDEADRLQREARIKQINVAMELISDRQPAA